MDRPRPAADHDELLAQLGWMRALARHLTRDAEVADDVLQRACLLALQRPAGVAAEGVGLRAWLAAVLRRVAGHDRRAAARSQAREQAAAAPEALPATIDLAARREILRRVVDAVMALDEPSFSTIVRRYYEGRSTLEIAAQDGVSPEVVRQRLARARARLRDRLTSTLDPRWLPALALLSPRPAASAPPPPPLSQLVMRGLIMAEATARPFALKAAAAAALLALGAGTWYLVGTRDDDSPSVPAAVLPLAAEPSRVTPALPPLPPVPVQSPKTQSASVAPAEQPAPPLAAAPAAPSEDAAWTSLWSLADATVQGTLEFGQMLDTTQTLLELAQSKLAEQGTSTLYDPTAPLVILDAKGAGRATLTRKSSPTDALAPTSSYTFDVDLNTQDGHYTGLQEGQPSLTKLSIAFQLDTTGRATGCSTVVQNAPRPTAELYAHMLGRGPQILGGHLAVSPDGAEWRPLTWEAETDPKTGAAREDIGFRCRPGESQSRYASLDDPRVAAVAHGLAALGPAEPRR